MLDATKDVDVSRSAEADSDFFIFNVELEAVGGKIQDWRHNSGQLVWKRRAESRAKLVVLLMLEMII